MKRNALLIVMALAIIAVSFQGRIINNGNRKSVKSSVTIEYPANVKQIIDNKCYGCHSPEARSQKAKDALDWSALPGLDKAKQVSKLDKIIEVLNKGEMPPKQFIEKKPEAKISDEEVKTLKDWAQSTSDNLLK